MVGIAEITLENDQLGVPTFDTAADVESLHRGTEND